MQTTEKFKQTVPPGTQIRNGILFCTVYLVGNLVVGIASISISNALTPYVGTFYLVAMGFLAFNDLPNFVMCTEFEWEHERQERLAEGFANLAVMLFGILVVALVLVALLKILLSKGV